MAEASGSRTHLRHKVPHNGFEARTQHRPRLASRRDCTRSIHIDRRCCRCRRGDATLKAVLAAIPRSSNGRTAAFGAVNRGSNPCRGAILLFSRTYHVIPADFCTDDVRTSVQGRCNPLSPRGFWVRAVNCLRSEKAQCNWCSRPFRPFFVPLFTRITTPLD